MEAGKLIVLTGPSGVGKGTLLRSLLERHPELYLSISLTTRSPRPGEIDGKHYYFVTPSQFKGMIAANQLLEWAEYAGNYYGTPRQQVEQRIRRCECVILEIEVEGARQIRQTFPAALRIFILPPSIEELEKRIRGRGSNSEAEINTRLAHAKAEIAAADEFDIQIVNDDFDKALITVETVVFTPRQDCFF